MAFTFCFLVKNKTSLSLKGFYSPAAIMGSLSFNRPVQLSERARLCGCLAAVMKQAPCSSPRLPHTCHLARPTPGSSPPNAHTYAPPSHTYSLQDSPPACPPFPGPFPPTRRPVSANQLNRPRPENNLMTDSPSGLPLSAQPAWTADSRGRGWTG